MHEKNIDYLSLFPKRGDHNAVWTEKKTKQKNTRTNSKAILNMKRLVVKKIEATQNDNNTGNALQRSVA